MKSRKMDVPEPIWRWLHTVKLELTAERGRPVTFPEVWEWLRQQQEAK